ncbi:aminoglycoside phosphotransferase [Streptomyces sp. AJS327]|uniref:aminoglycoside phosphotransferase n=1 Tax=Streptomyces sp. AJS327 TaxID=2545265 RepID=UPI0015DF0490|nr:aminoglycoside phosphotransferase [Streptomyces sp. AJS327]MBA0053717.1 aminoglycoside phosphotransferase [Streptomyces sp. AJS327]
MVTMKLNWADLPESTRDTITEHTGPITGTQSTAKGMNSEIAVTLDADRGRFFLKGRRNDHPQAWTQQREAAINPYVVPLAPRLVWALDDGEWNLLVFEHVDGRPVNYCPGSKDLPRVAEAISTLSGVHAPANIEMKQIEQRLAAYIDRPEDAALLSGETVLHTDWTPDNVLIHNDAARIVDWAWPTRGAAWVDAACWAVWLISAGHAPHQAEQWASKTPAWATTTNRALHVFAAAQARLWTSIAEEAPDTEWKQSLATAAHQWVTYRRT